MISLSHRRSLMASLTVLLCLFTVHLSATPGNAQETGVNQPAFDKPYSGDRVDASRIRSQQAAETAALLDQIPGVMSHEAWRGSRSLSVRGLTGERAPILLDGVHLTNGLQGTIPGHFPGTISPHLIQSARVVRGPAADRFGNGAIGGTIYLTTRNARNLPRTHETGGGKWFLATGDHTAGTAFNAARFTDAYALALSGDYTGVGEIRAGEDQKMPFSTFEKANWHTSLTLRPAHSAFTVTGAYLGHFSNNIPRTDYLDIGRLVTADISDNLVYVRFDWKPVEALEEFGIVASYHQIANSSSHLTCPVTGGKYRIDYHECARTGTATHGHRYRDIIDTFGLNSNFAMGFLKRRIRLGGSVSYMYDAIMSGRSELRHDDGQPHFSDQTRGVYSPGSFFSRFNAALHVDTTLLKTVAGNLQTHLGGRFANFAGYAPVVPDENEDIFYSFSGFIGNAGIQWLYGDILNLYGTFSQGFRAPGIQETTALGYVAGQFHIPNPELTPETAYHYEIGSRIQIHPVSFSVAWFHNYIDDYIDERPSVWNGRYTTPEGIPVVRRENAEHAVIKGFENTLAVHILGITVSGDLTWMRGTVHDASDGYFAQLVNNTDQFPVRRMPSLFGSGGVRYDDAESRFYAEFFVNFAAAQDRLHPMDRLDPTICDDVEPGSITCAEHPGWHTLNLRSGFRLTRNAMVDLSARNLADIRYKTIGSTYPAPGFDARGTLSIFF